MQHFAVAGTAHAVEDDACDREARTMTGETADQRAGRSRLAAGIDHEHDRPSRKHCQIRRRAAAVGRAVEKPIAPSTIATSAPWVSRSSMAATVPVRIAHRSILRQGLRLAMA